MRHGSVVLMDQEKRWYVIHTLSGHENKVKTNLEKRIKTMEKEDKIFRVLVPEEEEIVVKDGKKKVMKRKTYPAYVMVEMIMDEDSWYVVRNTPGVTGFVGPANRPVPLPEDEAKEVLLRAGVEEPKPRVDYEPGEHVKVVAGPFRDFTGVIQEIHPEKGKVRVLVSMFGRETPVELDFAQVEKI